MHHGAHGKLKLFHLEDGGFNHQRDYKSFIRYSEDVKSNYGWQVNYNKFSLSYQLVLANKQNQELYNTFAYFNPFLFDCIINDDFEILPLGSVNIEEPLV